MYSEKYEDFQSTLTRSNDVFSNFKSEMEKVGFSVIYIAVLEHVV